MSLRVRLAAAASLVAVLATTPAHALVYGVKSVKVTNVLQSAADGYIQITELEIFDSNGLNVSRDSNGGIAESNQEPKSNWTSNPNLVNNGVINGDYDSNEVFHGTFGGWIVITFAYSSNLKSISIFGRSDCCSQRDFYNVELFNAEGNSLYTFMVDARNADHMGSYEFIQDINPPSPGEPGVSGVPEPATWAMMISGFGLAGAAVRRRRTALTAG